MKVIKYLIWLILVLVVVAVAAAVFVVKTVDPNDYKPKIAEQVKKHTGRDIQLDGQLSLSFFPWVGVETGKVSLSNAPGFGDAPMVAIDNALAKVKLLPLLKKQIEVDTVVLEKPTIRLSTNKDGVTNWDDLIKGSKNNDSSSQQEEPSDGATGAGAIAGLAIKGVSINDGYVEWIDGQNGKDLTLKQLNLSTGSLVPGKPLDIQLSVNAEGNLIPEPATVSLDTTITLNDDFTDASLDNTDFSIKMNTIGAKLDAGKIAYGIESGIAVITGLAADVDYKGVQSSLNAPSINLDTKAETISLPDLKVTQGGSTVDLNFEGAGILSSPAGSGNLNVVSDDINALLERNGIVVPQLTQSLKNLSLSSAINFANNQLDLSGFAFSSDVNSLPTTAKIDALSVGIADFGFKASAIDVQQTDFTLKVDSIAMAGNSAEQNAAGIPIPTISGKVSASVKDVAELLSRNGVEVALPEIPVTNFSLDASMDSSNPDAIKMSAASIKLDHQGQPTTVSIPNLTFGLGNGSVDAERIDINQGDAVVAATAKGSGVLSGLSEMQLTGVFAAKVPAVADLLQRNAIEVELPAGVVNSVDAKFGFTLAENNLKVSQLDVKVDEMTLQGSVGLNNLDKPGYEFDLTINKLDLDSLLASMEEGASAEGEAAPETPSTGEQLLLPVAPLRGLNIDGKAKIGQFITTGLTLDDVNIVVKSDKNVLRVVPVTAKLFGGSMETQLTYDVSKDVPSMKTVNKVENVNIGDLLQALDITEKITGTGNLSTNLTAGGADADQMISSINGDIGFRLFDGAIRGYDLQASLLELEKTVKSLQGKETTEESSPAAETKFAEFSGSLVAKDGVFTNNDLNMKAPLFRVQGEGVIDLPKDRLDYKLNINVVETVEGQGGASLGDLKGTRIPFKIYGPLAEPSFTFDLASLLKERAKEEVKKEVKKKLLEKLSPDLANELGLGADSAEAAGAAEGASKQAAEQGAEQAVEEDKEPTVEEIIEDPKKALEDKLKKKLKKSLLKGLFN